MELRKLQVADLEAMKAGNAKVFDYENYRQYETAKSLCSRYGRILGMRFSCTDNHDGTFTVLANERN